MNEKEKKILEEFKKEKHRYELLEQIVYKKLQKLSEICGIKIYTIDHRIKQEKSLAGKLERKEDKYNSLLDITDILGLRVVCYFADDVDKLAASIESEFNINWNESIDKRKFLDIKSFGYLSVHYICSIKDDGQLPSGLENIQFEIQTCSLIQHVWAVMEHDLGYKTKFGIPRAVARDFSRLAGLLEIADEHFSRIRDNVALYTEQVHQKIVNDDANTILIDSVSLDEYMTYSKNMQAFLTVIGSFCSAEIYTESAENYIEQLAWLKKETIGDLQEMLIDNSSLALRIAARTICPAGLDILCSTAALRFLCLAELINKEYSLSQTADFFYLSTKDKSRAMHYAKELFRTAQEIK